MKPNRLILAFTAAACLISAANAAAEPSTAKGTYYTATAHSTQPFTLDRLTFDFHGLNHRAPWCMFMVRLPQPVDLSADAQLRLRLSGITHDTTVKIEIRDQESSNVVYRSALRHTSLKAGQDAQIILNGKRPLDGLNPLGWQRKALWPQWDKIQYVGVIVEATYNTATAGALQLDGIDHVHPDGSSQPLAITTDTIQYFEFTPAKAYKKQPPSTQPRTAHEPSQQQTAPTPTPAQPYTPTPTAPEATQAIKRDDPSTALFVSGAGFKLDIDPLSSLGISSKAILREETHRIDALLINQVRKGFNDPNFDPRSMLTEPIQVRNAGGSIIFDVPGRPDIPRFRFTYEDVEVDSQSSIALDFRQQVHEAALLWTTPYLDDASRFRLTLEPTYQYFRTSTDTADAETRRDVHRGLINAVLHDEHQQRQFFFQLLYGKADHKNVNSEETEKVFRAEWRQWYNPQQTAFSTVGAVYRENVVTPNARAKDATHEIELFANAIVELDDQGLWRWFTEVAYFKVDTDAFLNQTLPSTNRVYDFYTIETRLTREIFTNVDLSVGLEHAVADTHDFDSLALVTRLSIFNAGPFRAEMGARRTWYYNSVDTELTTFFFEFNFAQ